MPGMPSRPMRTDGAGGVYVGGGATPGAAATAANPASAQPAMSREQAIAWIEEQRRMVNEGVRVGAIPANKFPPLPITPRTPPAMPPGVPAGQ